MVFTADAERTKQPFGDKSLMGSQRAITSGRSWPSLSSLRLGIASWTERHPRKGRSYPRGDKYYSHHSLKQAVGRVISHAAICLVGRVGTYLSALAAVALYTTVTLRSFRPWIEATSVSPRSTGPTPDGVPDMMTSPAANSKYSDR